MTTSRDDTTARLTVSIVLRDSTEFDVTVSLDVQRLQRCRLWIGPRGFGSATIAGTPEQFHALAAQIEACAEAAEQAEAGRALDDAIHTARAIQALTGSDLAGGAR